MATNQPLGWQPRSNPVGAHGGLNAAVSKQYFIASTAAFRQRDHCSDILYVSQGIRVQGGRLAVACGYETGFPESGFWISTDTQVGDVDSMFQARRLIAIELRQAGIEPGVLHVLNIFKPCALYVPSRVCFCKNRNAANQASAPHPVDKLLADAL